MKKPILIGGGIVLLVLLLGGAAFVGGRLLNGQGLLGLTWGNAPGRQMDIQPAKELPQTPADVRGVFDHRKDNSIFVGTGNIQGMKGEDQSGNPQISFSYSGPVVEVVVTTQTTLYRDTTMQQFNGPPPDGQRIQQVVEPGSLDDLGQTSLITVWGRKTGDRYIADVLVYDNPGGR